MQVNHLKEHLYQTAINGTLFSLRIPNVGFTRWLAKRLFGRRLSTILDVALEFDRKIVDESLTSACAWISGRCGLPPKVNWAERIPARGPVLVAANHPGYFEGMAIAAQLPRQDLKVLVGGIPYFSNLPNMKHYIMYTDRSTERNISALRQVIRHLKSGGVVLIFPTGHADPDPDTMQGAHSRFEDWSQSIVTILRTVPETSLLPAVVSGILEPKFLNHPLARRQKELVPKQRVAGFLQIYSQFRSLDALPMSHPRVSFGHPLSWDVLTNNGGEKSIMPKIIGYCQDLLAEHMALR